MNYRTAPCPGTFHGARHSAPGCHSTAQPSERHRVCRQWHAPLRDVAARHHSFCGRLDYGATSHIQLGGAFSHCSRPDAAGNASEPRHRGGSACEAAVEAHGPFDDGEARPAAPGSNTPADSSAAAGDAGVDSGSAGGATRRQQRTQRERLQRSALAACKSLWRSQTSSWRRLRKVRLFSCWTL